MPPSLLFTYSGHISLSQQYSLFSTDVFNDFPLPSYRTAIILSNICIYSFHNNYRRIKFYVTGLIIIMNILFSKIFSGTLKWLRTIWKTKTISTNIADSGRLCSTTFLLRTASHTILASKRNSA